MEAITERRQRGRPRKQSIPPQPKKEVAKSPERFRLSSPPRAQSLPPKPAFTGSSFKLPPETKTIKVNKDLKLKPSELQYNDAYAYTLYKKFNPKSEKYAKLLQSIPERYEKRMANLNYRNEILEKSKRAQLMNEYTRLKGELESSLNPGLREQQKMMIRDRMTNIKNLYKASVENTGYEPLDLMRELSS